MLTGIDVSHHQGNVVWSSVAAAGHSFAIVKATEGTGFRDTRFPQNWPGIAAAGLVRGAYHFLRDGNGASQARHFVNTVGSFDGALAVVDTERPATGTLPAIDDVHAFAAEFRRLVPGHPLIVYTGRWYWVGVIGNPYGADVGPLWHSEYDGVNPTDFDVANGPELDSYGGWTEASIWQHTSSGRCPGVAGACDLNIFYGTATELAVLAGAVPAPSLSEDIVMDSTYVLVKGDVEPWYWLVTGDTRSLLYGFDVVDRVSDSLNDTSYRIYNERLAAQGLAWRGGEQYYCYDGVDEAGHARPFVWDQGLVDRLVRTDVPAA